MSTAPEKRVRITVRTEIQEPGSLTADELAKHFLDRLREKAPFTEMPDEIFTHPLQPIDKLSGRPVKPYPHDRTIMEFNLSIADPAMLSSMVAAFQETANELAALGRIVSFEDVTQASSRINQGDKHVHSRQ